MMIWKMTEKKKEDMSARKLGVRQVTSMNARITENKGRPQNKAMRVGTGGSLVHTAEQLQVEEQNYGKHSAIQKRKIGN